MLSLGRNAHARPAAPSVTKEDEYDLLDSIFDELDTEELQNLGQLRQSHPGKPRPALRTPASSQQTPSKPARVPLQAVTNNSGSRSEQKQKRKPATVGAKHSSPSKKPSSTSAFKRSLPPPKASTAAPSPKRPSAASRTRAQQQPLPPRHDRCSPLPRRVDPSSRQSATPAHRQRPAAVASPRKIVPALTGRQADEAALLDGLDWSDNEEDDLETALPQLGVASTSKLVPPPSTTLLKGRLRAQELANARQRPDYVPFSRRFTRCTVVSVSEKLLKDFRREKTLIVEIEPSKDLRRVQLFDEWATTEAEEGDIINIVGDFVTPPLQSTSIANGDALEQAAMAVDDPATGQDDADTLPTCYLSYSSPNLLILQPDTLVSATRVSDTPFCRRKAVVSEKVRSSASELTPALVYGNLLHELFQACLLSMSELESRLPHDATPGQEPRVIESSFGANMRNAEIDKLLAVPKNTEMLFMIGVELDVAREYLAEKSEGYMEFAERFIGARVKPESYLTDPRSREADPASSTRLAIAGVHDIEEDIISPRLGLKGKVDASIQATLRGPPSLLWPLGQEEVSVLPFEIKTGRSIGIMQHRAQTMLYTQMMSDRYDREIKSGLLYYTQTNSVIRVDAVRNELRGLIIGRNEMARCLAHPTPVYIPKTQEEEDNISALLPSGITDSVQQQGEAEPASSGLQGPAMPGIACADDEDDALWADMGEIDTSDLSSRNPTQKPFAAARPLLPEAVDEDRTCKTCYAADACMLYRRATENITHLPDAGERLQQMYNDRTEHLTDAQCEFFTKWERLISLEEGEMSRHKKEVWTQSARGREKSGRCLANMVIDRKWDGNTTSALKQDKGSIHRFTYRLVRSQEPASSASQASYPSLLSSGRLQDAGGWSGGSPSVRTSLLASQLSVGDPIIVSIEPSVLGLAKGFVTEMTAGWMEVGLNHSITVLPGDACDGFAPTSGHVPGDAIYRIDKDELQAGMGRLRDNLAQLFYAKGDEKRRRLIVDLERPTFGSAVDADLVTNGASAVPQNLNVDQQQAVEKVLSARDYALILGMPGTGKTTTVAEIIKALVAKGKSVLLTSYTHSAVDNILLKIKDSGIDILRLGNADRIMPALSHLTLSSRDVAKSISELEERYFRPQVVATTALSIDHPLFARRKFDYCIVDEASQITLPTCLGPLRYADTFVLVGDHNQLPPLVKSHAARAEGLDLSLFKRLSEAQPSALVYLTHQYRMNSDIMLLSNSLIYDNKLQCGSEQVASRCLSLPDSGAVRRLCSSKSQGTSCWLEDVVREGRKVVFVDTDELPARESKAGRLVQNETEADLLHQISEALLACGVVEEQIGIIALYRQQIKLLSGLLNTRAGIEILTADKSQGRDKDCILMSLVRSNAEAQTGDLLKDWRRLNVCLTRARSKLVIVGSRSTLSSLPLLQRLFVLLDERGWVYTLPAAVAHHRHENAATLALAAARPSVPHASSVQRMGRVDELFPSSSPGKYVKKRKTPAQAVPAGGREREEDSVLRPLRNSPQQRDAGSPQYGKRQKQYSSSIQA